MSPSSSSSAAQPSSRPAYVIPGAWQPDAGLLAATLTVMEATTASLPPRVRALWLSWADERELRTASGLTAIAHAPINLPLLGLPAWLGEALDLPLDVVAKAACSALLGYAVVRLQDDRLDEGRGPEPRAHLLAATLLPLSLWLLEEAAGTSMLADATTAWAAYAAGMALELAPGPKRAPPEPSAAAPTLEPNLAAARDRWRRSLARYRPLTLAPLALLKRADRWALHTEVSEAIEQIAIAHQGFDDAVDLPDDLARGNWTYLTEEARQREPPTWLWLVLPREIEASAAIWRRLGESSSDSTDRAFRIWRGYLRRYGAARVAAELRRLAEIRAATVEAVMSAIGGGD